MFYKIKRYLELNYEGKHIRYQDRIYTNYDTLTLVICGDIRQDTFTNDMCNLGLIAVE